ncbi:unannotated protein [freshwater metagenome]|uniref:Unannotated protein n=1 Tax=freshwater metagenome TaxID=449393 RepID=A0A6J7Q408_9ZZZZ
MRADKSGLICGIGGYPATECGVEIDMPTTDEEPLTATGSNAEENEGTAYEEISGAFDWSEILAIVLAMALAFSIFVIIRKRKK